MTGPADTERNAALPRRFALVLAGGSALGAYQAGAFEAVQAAGLEPEWICGTSIGAMNAAIIAGNPPSRRVEMLRLFWEAAAGPDLPLPGSWLGPLRRQHDLASALHTRLFGRPRLFSPRIGALLPRLKRPPQDVGLYDRGPFSRTLRELIDFDLLNGGDIRVTVAATDLETGEPVYFDTARQRLGVDHLLASAALPPDFRPVPIDGTLYWDGGLSVNLPLEPLFEQPLREDLFCLAIDLFDRRNGLPRSIDAATQRRDEIIFANQSARIIEACRHTHHRRRLSGQAEADVVLAHVSQRAETDEVAMRIYDYSASTLAGRREAGRQATAAALTALPARRRSADGFTVCRLDTLRPPNRDAAAEPRAAS